MQSLCVVWSSVSRITSSSHKNHHHNHRHPRHLSSLSLLATAFHLHSFIHVTVVLSSYHKDVNGKITAAIALHKLVL